MNSNRVPTDLEIDWSESIEMIMDKTGRARTWVTNNKRLKGFGQFRHGENKHERVLCFRCLALIGYGSIRACRQLGIKPNTTIQRLWSKLPKSGQPLKKVAARLMHRNKPKGQKIPNQSKVKMDWFGGGYDSFIKNSMAYDTAYRGILLYEQQKHRARTEPQSVMRSRLRRRIRKMIGQQRAHRACWKMIGCDWTKFKEHIESHFTSGMGWHNYGLWHIDHVVPSTMFDLTDEQQQVTWCHYSNLQPLWADDNLKKSAKVNMPDYHALIERMQVVGTQ